MSLFADILDRLSGVTSLKEKIAAQDKVLEQTQRIMLEQQKDIAELRGRLKHSWRGEVKCLNPSRPSYE